MFLGTSINSSLQNATLGLRFDKNLLAYLNDDFLKIGSNNWVTRANLSPGVMPVVANDPHQDASILPGPLYPCGLMTPDLRAVGVTVPGFGGMVIGRTAHIALGATNAYGDTQDLYVETIDPDNPHNYLEGSVSILFVVIEETLKIKDKTVSGGFKEEKIIIRLTRRGPVISDVIPGLETNKVITVRWSGFEVQSPSIGLEKLVGCRTVEETRQALGSFNQIALNFVIADTKGNIGWQTTGKIPLRTQEEGLVPYVVRGSTDNWTGWIPWEDMPHAVNPERDWLGTCNQLTVGRDYPYHYTTHASPTYRYRRLIELMDAPGKKSVDDHWAFQRDALNLMGKTIAPIISRVLLAHEDTKNMGQILADWDFVDAPGKAAPTIFQAVYREFALLAYADELGDDLADPDKILAVLPGGVAGRQFDPHTTDQVESYMNGDKVYWWFSDKAIKEHTQHTLTLSPN